MTYLRRIIKDSTYNNKPVILSIQRYDESTGKVSHDTTVLDKQTLLPVAYQALVDQRVENYSFNDGRIKGIVSRKDSVLKQVVQVLENQTYCSVAELELLQALPLQLGYEATIQTINPGFNPSQITYKVLAEEVARINNGAIPCWVVRAVIDKRAGPTYWVAKGDQQLHKMNVTLGDGHSFWKVRMVDTW